MSNYQSIIDLVKQQNGKSGWSTQVYIRLTKDTLLGNFLDRVVWWSDKTGRNDGFFYKSADEWNEELFISYAQVKRLEKSLISLDFIEVKKMMANGAPTMHYRPKMDVIKKAVCELFPKVEIQEYRNSRKSNIEIQESSISEIQESSISITSNTNEDSSNNLSSNEDKGKAPSSPEKSKSKTVYFMPNSPEGRIFFALYNQHRDKVKRTKSKGFRTDEQLQKFNKAAVQLGCDGVKQATTTGLEQEITTVRGLLNYVAGWAKKDKNGTYTNGQSHNRPSPNGHKPTYTPEQLAMIEKYEQESKPP